MSASTHEQHDRELFNTIADKYFAKDIAPSSRCARRQRLLQSLNVLPAADRTSLLEVGCGTGFTAPYLEGRFPRFCGVDYAEQLIQYARQHNSGPGITFAAANIKDFRPDEPFDIVLMIGVLHHFDDIPAILAHIVKLVKPGGWIVANEPQPGNPLIRMARASRKKLDDNYSSDQCELSAHQLRELYTRAGLEAITIRPQGVFSTPFAEVVVRPQALAAPLSRIACATDRLLERTLGGLLRPLSWNLIAAGRRAA